MTNKLIVPNIELALNQLKEEIAQELGIELGADATSRDCGKVGGEITRRLIELGKNSLIEQSINPAFIPQTNQNQVNTTQNFLH
jgi:small acid-soluble spore protein A (major alpha-type SASP)